MYVSLFLFSLDFLADISFMEITIATDSNRNL